MNSILITGASSGIGYDLASYFVQRGFDVFASVRSAADEERLCSEFQERFHCLRFDITDRNAIAKAAQYVAAQLDGRGLSALVNNAGIAVAGPLQLVDDDEFANQLRINVAGTRNVTNAFLPMLGASLTRSSNHPPGKIINMSSISGILNTPLNGAYCIAKHAIESMAEVYRRELYIYGIPVISIQPGPIASRIWEKNIGSMSQMEDSDYGPMIRSVNEQMERARQEALPAKVISELVHKIIKQRRPRTAYVVHSRVWTVRLFANWLPRRLVDRILHRQLSTKRNSTRMNNE
jgi:NAD(P)-dependent dehydrogenase (short-subunit alcohol dehydrogenase family)